MKLGQEHQHSMSQNVDQHSEHITESRKDSKLKFKMPWTLLTEYQMCVCVCVWVCVCVREREREDEPGDQQQHLEVRFG
jgi:hypothetical protein